MTAATPSPSIETATLQWKDGKPVSSRFNDVNSSCNSGLEAPRHAFITPSNLPARFSALAGGEAFVVAESGFGTGLNFLATWHAWHANAHPEAQLHFVSVEHHPLTREDLQRATEHWAECWPELSDWTQQLAAQYPPAVRGTHRLLFKGGRIRLTLHFGDVIEGWNRLRFIADAWLLSDLVPEKGAGSWAGQAAKAIATHSHANTTLATATSKDAVTRALNNAGFTFCETPHHENQSETRLYTAGAGRITRQPTGPSPRAVTVIGAGIAGASTARNLAERGVQVTVLAKGPQPADGASGNPQGALYVKLGVDFGPETELALLGLLHSQRAYQALTTSADPADADAFWFPTGLLQMAVTPRERDRQARFLERNDYPAGIFRPVGAEEATALAGIPVNHEGLYFPDSGWLIPAKLCQALLDHPNITTRFNTDVTDIVPEANGWCIRSRDNADEQVHKLVIAGGHEIASLLPGTTRYRFKPIRGQVTSLPAGQLCAPQRVVCGHGYVNPVTGGQSLIGATFDLKNSSPDVTTASHDENLSMLTSWLPDLLDSRAINTESLQGRVSFRCTTHDYQPAVGAVDIDNPDDDQSKASLFVLTGLGSKGLSFAPLLAEWLTDVITGQPECLEQRLSARLSLARCQAQDG